MVPRVPRVPSSYPRCSVSGCRREGPVSPSRRTRRRRRRRGPRPTPDRSESPRTPPCPRRPWPPWRPRVREARARPARLRSPPTRHRRESRRRAPDARRGVRTLRLRAATRDWRRARWIGSRARADRLCRLGSRPRAASRWRPRLSRRPSRWRPPPSWRTRQRHPTNRPPPIRLQCRRRARLVTHRPVTHRPRSRPERGPSPEAAGSGRRPRCAIRARRVLCRRPWRLRSPWPRSRTGRCSPPSFSPARGPRW
mmetsp:Transcript_8723/g.34286  ORF Transcript_8723/g.34286 Transcript_8723/m.34286 type:complete len:253 (-) Transcript_8723:861-1619(-)